MFLGFIQNTSYFRSVLQQFPKNLSLSIYLSFTFTHKTSVYFVNF